jgi:hypothetical protein
MMTLCSENDELSKFESESLRQLIEYKWETFGRNHHFVGCVLHIVNTLVIILYILSSYYAESSDSTLVILLACSVTYPLLYETFQLFMNGGDYLWDKWNYADMSYIVMGFINIYLQIVLGPFNTICRALMCFVICMLIMKTFFFLRIFPALTPIVVMINSVIWDLRIFMLFYFLLIAFFCQGYAVLGVGNVDIEHRRLKGGSGGGSGGGGF